MKKKGSHPVFFFMKFSNVLSTLLIAVFTVTLWDFSLLVAFLWLKERLRPKSKSLKPPEKPSKVPPFCCLASENAGLCLDAEVALATGQLLAPSSQQSSSAASRGDTPCSFNEEDEEDEDEDSSSPEWGQEKMKYTKCCWDILNGSSCLDFTGFLPWFALCLVNQNGSVKTSLSIAEIEELCNWTQTDMQRQSKVGFINYKWGREQSPWRFGKVNLKIIFSILGLKYLSSPCLFQMEKKTVSQ